MLSFNINTQPFARFTEKVVSVFTPTKKVEVMCRLSGGHQPVALSHRRVYDRRAIHYYHHKHGWIPRNQGVWAKLNDFLSFDGASPPPKPKRFRQNMSHLTPAQKRAMARAKREGRKRAYHY